MYPIKRILVPLDFGAASAEATDYALEIAARTDAEVVLVHVYELPAYGGNAFMGTDVPERIRNVAQAALDAAVTARMNSIKVTGVLREGSPWRVVNEVAEEVSADLIVMGTHGRRGISRALLGSVAEKVIRTSTRPVLTVREPKAQELHEGEPAARQPRGEA